MTDSNKISDKIRSIFQYRWMEQLVVLFTKGLYYSKWMRFFVPNHYQYQNGSWRSCRRNSINYLLDISDLMDWYEYFGFKEREKINLFRTIHRSGYIIDAGANIGQMTLNFAKLVGNDGRVFSFEPDEKNFSRLHRNVSLNNFPQIRLNKVGLSKKPSKGNMIYLDEHNSGMNKMEISDEGTITITTIDEYVSQNAINTITHIKIDTEGFEMKILTGAIHTIQKFKPILFIEIDDKNLKAKKSSPTELFQFLLDNDYRLYYAINLKPLSLKQEFDDSHFDIIAF